MDGLWRLIDANANRAREGLRVVEDVARFAIEDLQTLGTIKGIRHALTGALRELDPGGARFVRARDVDGDAGTSLSGAGESSREDLASLVSANAKRAQESLRAIEEACKALPGGASVASRIERARYDTYACEARLVMGIRNRTVPGWPLCVIVTRALCAHHAWQEVIRLSAQGGAACFQLREKGATPRELAALAGEFVALCKELGVCSIINDRPDIALMVGADGVHVGVDDPPIAEVVRTFGDRLIVGASAPSMGHAREAIEGGAHYLGVGAMFPTSTKEKDTIEGPGFLREVLALEGCPHALAIGGISAGNVGEVVDAGGRGVAVSSGVCGAEDPQAACIAVTDSLKQVCQGDDG